MVVNGSVRHFLLKLHQLLFLMTFERKYRKKDRNDATALIMY